jgi:hypothetical protein
MRAAFVIATMLVPAVASAVTPSATGTAGSSPVAVNAGPGDQTEPHVAGDLAVYTDNDGASSTIHYYSFSGMSDSVVPAGDPGDNDVLSDVNGTRIAFSRTRAADSATACMVYDVATNSMEEVAPGGPGTVRFGTVLGGTTVAFAEFASGVGEIMVFDLATNGPLTPLTSSSANDTNPNIAPSTSSR